MSPTVGHIRNPTATRNRGQHNAEVAGVMQAAPKGFEALGRDLAAMAEVGVEVVVIDGGDGTVREVLSRALPIWAGKDRRAPNFAIIASGNTNLIARSAGSIRAEDLPALVETTKAFRAKTIPLLKASREGCPPVTGFILGAGAYETATRMAQEEIGSRHGLQVILAVIRLIGSQALRTPTDIGVGFEDAAPPQPRTLIGITTLPGALIYRINPFWNGTGGPLRWLDIAAQPPRLIRAVLRIIARRPARWMDGAYTSGTAEKMVLTLSTPFVMDGEAFSPGADGIVRLSAKQTATFLSRR